jgi:hypothetical protein
MANRSFSWIAPLVLGATAMYLFDPDRGNRRRALIRDAAVRASRKTRDGMAALGCDLRNRGAGAVAEVRGWFEERPGDDRVMVERVRAELGRVSSHPGAIDVFASGGRIALSGPVLASEHAGICRAIGRVRGVETVIDNLEVHNDPDSIPSLQGGVTRPGQMWLRGSWSPTTQFAAALAGAGLLAYGARLRRG